MMFLRVGKFKHLLGLLPTPTNLLEYVPVKIYPKGLNLPRKLNAWEAWPHCTSIQSTLVQYPSL